MKGIFKKTGIVMLLLLSLVFISCSWGNDEISEEIDIVTADTAALEIIYSGNDSSSNVTHDIILTLSGDNGSTISWASNKLTVIANNGTVIRPVQGSADETVTLTATIEDGSDSKTKVFTLIVTETPTPFETTWKTDNAGTSGSNQIKLPLDEDGTFDFDVDWGDGNTNRITSYNQAEATHTYSTTGTYDITLVGTINGFGFKSSGEDNQKLLDIKKWGNVQLHNKGYLFYNIVIVAFTASDVPDLSNVTNMSVMFSSAEAFNQDIGSWDVSKVTNMNSMFRDTNAFNQDLNSWNVSKVSNMIYMFYNADAFNQNLNSWDVSKVTDMRSMFSQTNIFNGDISSWDVSNVTNMRSMFSSANTFNGNISSWDVSKVTNMNSMFYHANAFNGDISSWDVSNVTTMSSMFSSANTFNGNISSWNVSNVTNMSEMFHATSAFNGNISSWNVSSVTNMSGMFKHADVFNGNISSWNVSNVSNMLSMFYYANIFDQDLESWAVDAGTIRTYMFLGSPLEGSEPSWY